MRKTNFYRNWSKVFTKTLFISQNYFFLISYSFYLIKIVKPLKICFKNAISNFSSKLLHSKWDRKGFWKIQKQAFYCGRLALQCADYKFFCQKESERVVLIKRCRMPTGYQTVSQLKDALDENCISQLRPLSWPRRSSNLIALNYSWGYFFKLLKMCFSFNGNLNIYFAIRFWLDGSLAASYQTL